jgi:hypothetical protein
MIEEGQTPMNDADAALLEKLVEAGFDPGAVDGLDEPDRLRLERLSGMLGLLDGYPSESLEKGERDTLVNATLARIDRHDQEQSERLKFSADGGGGARTRFGPLELVAIAAILIIGVAVIFPIMNAGKRSAQLQHSSQNLAMIGQGLFNYASSNDNRLPSSAVEKFAPVFGEAPQRLDLDPLSEHGYLDHEVLGNPSGYSLQTQPAHHHFVMSGPGQSILMGDLNPTLEHISIITVDEAHKGLRIQSQTTISWSPNVLFSDGSSQQLADHFYGDDDLRLPSEQWRDLGHPDAFLTH